MSTSSRATRLRGVRLARLLIGAGAPLAALTSVAATSLTALGGCSCPTTVTTFYLDSETYFDLADQYGGDDSLPAAECARLCVSPRFVGQSAANSSSSSGAGQGGIAGAGGAMIGGGGAAGAEVGDGGAGVPTTTVRHYLTIDTCYLSSIDFDHLAVTCEGEESCGGAGRRPPGFVPRAVERSAELAETARYLARVAELEAASVAAFARIARELTVHGAPQELIAAAHAAMLEERDHAHAMGDLARAYGVEPQPVEVRPLPLRGLLELALDNAVAGCVGEAYAATEAAYAAEHAEDGHAAAVWRRIAADEAGHAALSFAIDDWVRECLPGAARQLAARRATGVRRLAAQLGQRGPELCRRLGLPDAARAAQLLATLNQQLWQAAA